MKYFIFLLSFLLFSCSSEEQQLNNFNEPDGPGITLKHLAWLKGTWQFNSKEGIMYEIWKLENDSLMTGAGFLMNGKDTLFSEKIQLVQTSQGVEYRVRVSNQNQNEEVSFRFVKFKKGEYIFANPEHDFPQRIIYKNPQPDFLCVRIEGSVEGKSRQEDFNFLKMKN